MGRIDERSATEAKPAATARLALAGLCLSMLMPSLDTSIANIGLPTLASAFRASFQEVQWIVLAYLLAITSLIVGAGRLGDLVGRRRLLLIGIGLFTGASLLCGLAPSLWLLVAARAAQGLGAAVMMALTMGLVGDTVPKARIGSAMGLLGTMSAIGTTLGPSLGGALIAGPGWRWIFLINIPLGLLNLYLARTTLPADRPRTRAEQTRFDAVGTLLLAATLAAYALAMTLGQGAFGAVNLALLAGATVGAGLFLRSQARGVSPLLRIGMFRDPILGAGLTMSMLVSTVMMATLVVGPFYLSRGLGLGAALVGLVMSAGPFVAALAGVPSGRIVDRVGAGRATFAGLSGMIAGLAALAFAPAILGAAGYVAAIVVVTGSYALFQAANNTTVMTGVGPEGRGVVSGMLSLSRNLGLITGASVMGAIFAAASGSSDVASAHPHAVAGGMQTVYCVAACLVGIALSVAAASRAGARAPA